MANDLAAGGTEFGPLNYDQLFAGEAPIITGNAVAATVIQKHEVVTVLANGQLSNDFTGVSDGAKCVIAAQAAQIGQSVPYFAGGSFNDAKLVWPAGASFDTLVERKRFFMGTPIHIGTIDNA